jgi:hypothetical protein
MANGTLKVSNIETSSGSGTITLGQSGETVTIPTGTTVSGAMSNTPVFSAYQSSAQTISSGTATKVQYNTKHYDSDNAYDNSSNYRFTVPSGKAGKYFFSAIGSWGTTSNENAATIDLRVNGTVKWFNRVRGSGTANILITTSAVFDLSASDYVEVFLTNATGFDTLGGDGYSNFLGYKLIGA